MAINTLEYAKLFQTNLDEQMIDTLTSGWMDANAGQVIYNGGDEVKIPSIAMSGMGNYNRDTGFVQGSVTFKYDTYKLTQDRGRTFQLDAMDVNETNFGATAGTVMGEFQRVGVVAEVDAYRYSTIFNLASTANKASTYTPAADTIVSKLADDIAKVQDLVGEGEEIVITMSLPTAVILDGADGIDKHIDVSNFVQGNVNRKIKTFDGHPIIRVSSGRMKTKYVVQDGTTAGQEAGGLKPDAAAKDINWIITVRRCPIAVTKTDVVRIFDPMQNQKANAWKLDYRKYHDVWVPTKKLDGVWVSSKA